MYYLGAWFEPDSLSIALCRPNKRKEMDHPGDHVDPESSSIDYDSNTNTPATKKMKKEQTAANENTQSLGDMVYQVFMRTWCIEEAICQAIIDDFYRLDHLNWQHFREKQFIRHAKGYYKYFTSQDGYKLKYDPDCEDGWTETGRKQHRAIQRSMQYIKSKLAGNTFNIDNIKSNTGDRHSLGEPILPEKGSHDVLYRLLEEFY